MRLLNSGEVAIALTGAEGEVLAAVRRAYLLHAAGQTQVPFSSFLRPIEKEGSRIIVLPAYLGGDDPAIGVKWISSFPENVRHGYQRASSISVLNSLETGYPMAALESSQVSAARTAASAALASSVLAAGTVETVGLIGTGTINHRTISYLTIVHPTVRTVLLYDVFAEHAKASAAQLAQRYPGLRFIAVDLAGALSAEVVSIATTDSSYWLDLGAYASRPAGQVVLHLSLRDLSIESILDGVNVVDDVDHVLRERTSLHLAEQRVGHRAFVAGTLGDLLGGATLDRNPHVTTVFSPFGLGVLDLAVSQALVRIAERDGLGTEVAGFDPGSHLVTSSLQGGGA
jgi:2,3-diaminopropionate biosynthesis protein SbnB